MSQDITFFESSPFFASPSPTSKMESMEDFLIYTVSYPTSTASSDPPRPLITYVYTCRDKPPQSNVAGPQPADLLLATSSLPASASSDSDLDLPIALRKDKHNCTHPISSFVSYNHLSQSTHSFVTSLDSMTIPKILDKALSHNGWRTAMEEEMSALEANGTWDLIFLSSGERTIGCKWVYVVKMTADGFVDRLKARLVAKGYVQTYGVDYTDTFSLVAKMTSIRIFIFLAATYCWPSYQLDVKNAFLHGDLQEEVYIEQPPRFVAQGEYGKVCNLKKSLYGLKQSLRA